MFCWCGLVFILLRVLRRACNIIISLCVGCRLPKVSNAEFSNLPPVLSVDTQVRLSCAASFIVEGTSSHSVIIHCRENGELSTQNSGPVLPVPECIEGVFKC